jgi:hypothetical protein
MRRTQYLKDEIEKNLQKKTIGLVKVEIKKKIHKNNKKIYKTLF